MTTAAPTPLPPLPPWVHDPHGEWISLKEFARRWNKRVETVRVWCKTGFIQTLSLASYRDSLGHWYIRVS